jgi:hypothetical protein
METDDFMLAAVEDDFSVDLLSKNGASALYGALRKGGTERLKTPDGLWETHTMGVWHFVAMTGDGNANRICQWHIPRFSMTKELAPLVGVSTALRNAPHPLVGRLEEGLGLAVFEKKQLGFLLDGPDGTHSGIKTAFRSKLKRDLKILNEAESKVVTKGDGFCLEGVTTPEGNPVQSPSRSLIEAIAFEQICLGHLDPGNFGIYSAFCTYRDFDTSIEMPDSLIEELVSVQFACRPNQLDDEVLEVFAKAQKKTLTKPIWGPGIKMKEAEACGILTAGMRGLSRHRRVQFMLMNGMHGAALFLALAAAANVIGYRRYAELQCLQCQVDSPQEQDLRKETAFIKLYGELAEQVA